MNTLLLVAQVLTCLVAVNYLPVDGQSTCCPTENCCIGSCTPPDPFNVTLDEFVSQQPLYVAFYPNIPNLAGVDSSCYTFCPLPDGTYLLNVVRQYVNDLNVTESFTIDELGIGDFQAGSSSCVEEFTIFDLVNNTDCLVYLAYVCFNFGGDGCTLSLGNDIPVMGFTPNMQAITQACLDESVDRISRAGVDSQNYTIVQMTQPATCITNINCTVHTAAA